MLWPAHRMRLQSITNFSQEWKSFLTEHGALQVISTHWTQQSCYFSTLLHYYSKHCDQTSLFYMLWEISEVVILQEYVKIQFKMTITQIFRYLSNVWYIFCTGLSNTKYSCWRCVLENTYTTDQGTHIWQDGTNLF